MFMNSQAASDRARSSTHADHPIIAVLSGLDMAMVLTDPDQPDNAVVYVNEAFAELTGYGPSEALGRNCRFLQGPATDPAAVAAISEAIRRGQAISLDLLNYRRDGTEFWNALCISPVRDLDGKVHFFLASQLDVTAHVNARKALLEHDPGDPAAVDRRIKARLLDNVEQNLRANLETVNSLIALRVSAIDHQGFREALAADFAARVGKYASLWRARH